MQVDARRLLQDCADLYVVCDDGTKIPCSKFHVSRQCQILFWVREDVTDMPREIPFPGIPSKNLQLALDIIHDISHVDNYSLQEIDAAIKGFDVLGCAFDTSPRVWDLVRTTATIDHLRARLPKLMRSKDVERNDVIRRVVTLAPLYDDVILTMKCCQPDAEMAVYLAITLGKYVPIIPLLKHILNAVPNMTTDQILRVAGCNGIGTYIHPREVSEILAFVRDALADKGSASVATYSFMRAMASAMHTYDCVPLSCSTLNGSLVMFHDAQSVSLLIALDGTPPQRRIKMTKWMTFSLEHHRAVATIRAHGIDMASKSARCMDVRMFARTSGQHAELWHSWRKPTWIPMTEVSTTECPRVTGDKAVFDAVVEAGLFSKRMTIRIDVFYGETSALDMPPLF